MVERRENKEKLWELGTWEHGNFEREQRHPPSPDGDYIFKENPAASHMTIQMLLLILAYLFFIL